jgi:hypothetical protein
VDDTGSQRFDAALVEAGIATQRQVDQSIGIQLELCRRGEPHKRLGDLCLRMGLLDGPQLAEALAEQQRLRTQGTFRRLGEILVERQRLKAAHISAVLKAQGYEIAECTKCRITYNIDLSWSPRPATCARCGRDLITVTAYDDDALEETSANGRRGAGAADAATGSTESVGESDVPTDDERRDDPSPLISNPPQAVIDLARKLQRAFTARREAERKVGELREKLAASERAHAAAVDEVHTLGARLADAQAESHRLAQDNRRLCMRVRELE